MTKQQLKLNLLKITPDCPRCGCEMRAVAPITNKGGNSHAAIVLPNNTLICFQCRRIEANSYDFKKLPLKRKIDHYTGIFTFVKRIKGNWNKFYWTKILGNKLKKGH